MSIVPVDKFFDQIHKLRKTAKKIEIKRKPIVVESDSKAPKTRRKRTFTPNNPDQIVCDCCRQLTDKQKIVVKVKYEKKFYCCPECKNTLNVKFNHYQNLIHLPISE